MASTGAAESIGSLVASIATVAAKLSVLKEKYRNDALHITLVAGNLWTVKASLEAIQVWKNATSDASRPAGQLEQDLQLSLESCAVVIAVVERTLGSTDLTDPGVHDKPRFLQLDAVFRDLSTSLAAQVSALQMLLTMYQCRDVSERTEKLGRSDTRAVLHVAADSTASLPLEEKDIQDAASVLSEDPSVNFAIDNELLNSTLYKRVYKGLYLRRYGQSSDGKDVASSHHTGPGPSLDGQSARPVEDEPRQEQSASRGHAANASRVSAIASTKTYSLHSPTPDLPFLGVPFHGESSRARGKGVANKQKERQSLAPGSESSVPLEVPGDGEAAHETDDAFDFADEKEVDGRTWDDKMPVSPSIRNTIGSASTRTEKAPSVKGDKTEVSQNSPVEGPGDGPDDGLDNGPDDGPWTVHVRELSASEASATSSDSSDNEEDASTGGPSHQQAGVIKQMVRGKQVATAASPNFDSEEHASTEEFSQHSDSGDLYSDSDEDGSIVPLPRLARNEEQLSESTESLPISSQQRRRAGQMAAPVLGSEEHSKVTRKPLNTDQKTRTSRIERARTTSGVHGGAAGPASSRGSQRLEALDFDFGHDLDLHIRTSMMRRSKAMPRSPLTPEDAMQSSDGPLSESPATSQTFEWPTRELGKGVAGKPLPPFPSHSKQSSTSPLDPPSPPRPRLQRHLTPSSVGGLSLYAPKGNRSGLGSPTPFDSVSNTGGGTDSDSDSAAGPSRSSSGLRESSISSQPQLPLHRNFQEASMTNSGSTSKDPRMARRSSGLSHSRKPTRNASSAKDRRHSDERLTKAKLIHRAAAAGDLALLAQSLQESRKDFQTFVTLEGEKHAKTPLMRAAVRGHTRCMELLVLNGAEFGIVDKKGRSALYHAVEAEQLDSIKWLADNFRVAANHPGYAIPTSPLEVRDKYGYRVLHVAAALARIDIMDVLLVRGAKIDGFDNSGRTPLYYAILSMHYEAFEYLVEKGASITVVDVDKETPLIWAAKANAQKAVDYMLEKGVYRHAQDINGDLAVHHTARNGHMTILHMLTLSLDDLEAKNKLGERPLHVAAGAGQTRVVKALLGIGCQVNVFTEPPVNKGPKKTLNLLASTPLHYACSGGYYDASASLIQYGASVNASQEDGTTPLMMACLHKNKELVFLLLENGADIEAAKPATLITALHIAARGGDLGTVKLLVDYGASLKATTKGKTHETALEFALAAQNHGKKNPAADWLAKYQTNAMAHQMRSAVKAGKHPAGGRLQGNTLKLFQGSSGGRLHIK